MSPTSRVQPGVASVVLATHNAKKLAELRRILDDTGLTVEVIGLDDVEPYPEPQETESTFEGNALVKAREAVARTGLPALADDSGVEVDVLNRMPGVRSSRWAGPDASDADNLVLLLRQLADVPDDRRTARFVCAMALVQPDGSERLARGVIEGRLTREPRGDHGFGYDPIFVPDGHALTTAEMAPPEKDAVSHRGQAVREMARIIADVNRVAARNDGDDDEEESE